MASSSHIVSRGILGLRLGLGHRGRDRAGGTDAGWIGKSVSGRTQGLFIAFLVLLAWLPIPLGSARPLYWTAMEIWVYLLAAAWLFRYARGRVETTTAFRRARPALLLLGLWLAYGLFQMVPLPGGVLDVISPNAAAFHRDAATAAALDAEPLVPNPVLRPLPSVPAEPGRIDGPGGPNALIRSAPPAAGLPTPVLSEPAQQGPGSLEPLNLEPAPSHVASPDPAPPGAQVTQAWGGLGGADAATLTASPVTVADFSGPLTLDLPGSVEAWLKSMAYVLVFALTLLLVDSPYRLKILAYVLVLSGLAQAVYGSISLALSTGGVATGTFVNRNHFAAYLVLCVSVGIGLLVASLVDQGRASTWRERIRRMGRLVLSSRAPLRFFLAIMVIALVLTRSRMGNASFFISLLIAGGAALLLQRRMPRPVMILIASLIVIDLLIIGSWVGIDRVRDRVVETTLQTEIRDETTSHSLALLRDYPVFGSGAGSYYLAYMRYRQGDDGEGMLFHAHNDYIELASEYGLVGLALIGGVVVLGLVQAAAAQRRRRDTFARGMGLAALMATSAMLIHASVEFNLRVPVYAATFMVVLAMAWLSLHLREPGRESRRAKRRRPGGE